MPKLEPPRRTEPVHAAIARRPAAPVRTLPRLLQHGRGGIVIGSATAAVLALLFGFGTVIGSRAGVTTPIVTVLSPSQRTLDKLGVGPGRFVCSLESDPPGSQVAVDGKSLGVTTPIRVELSPGRHRITLSLAQYGARTLEVTGKKNDHLPLSVALYGRIQVRVSRKELTPVQVAVDGEDRGLAPILIDHLSPGPHELEFSTGTQEPWGRIVAVRIGEETGVSVQPFKVPADGILVVDATREDDSGDAPAHAQVWVDGTLRGRTPLTLTLPRGPHSVRGELASERSAVQVIDLPGGNQRIANMRFGAPTQQPQLAMSIEKPQRHGPLEVKATLRGIKALELASMWLFVRRADGRWSRLPMTISPVPGGAVGAIELPPSDLVAGAPPRLYVNAQRATGEEYFTEIGAPDVQPRSGSHLMGAIP